VEAAIARAKARKAEQQEMTRQQPMTTPQSGRRRGNRPRSGRKASQQAVNED
jgi:hypothetical protein